MRQYLTGMTVAALAMGTVALGEEYPDPNPAPNGDGTYTWWVGNNTQYPVIQDVLDACGDGDEVVVAGGLYVESLSIDNNDLTLRPFCDGGRGASAHWAQVTFWNPTEGFENDNQYAMHVTGGSNTYIGRPRMLTQLPNTNYVTTTVVPGEWENPGGAGEDVQDISANTPYPTLTFWSRSIDNVAVYSTDGLVTFQECEFTSSAGFGGCAMITGANNTTQFISCEFVDTFAGGQPFAPNGLPVNVITIQDGEPQFHDCGVHDNEGGITGIINQSGGGGIWYDSSIVDNYCMSGNGTYMCEGGTPAFYDCDFASNNSREGTVYFDSTGVDGARFMNFVECNFDSNETSGAQYGGAVMVVCSDCAGDAPEISFSNCGFDNNNGNSGLGAYDIESPYFPEYRIAADIDDNGLVTDMPGNTTPADINNDGAVDGADLNELFSMLGTCYHDSNMTGTVEIDDLLELIAAYGNACN